MGVLEKFGKLLLEVFLVSIGTAFIASLITYLISAITPIAGIFGGLLVALVTLFLFSWALAIHPGREYFIEVIPVIVLVAAIIELWRGLMPEVIPVLVTNFTWLNLAILISSLFITDTIIKFFLPEIFK